jgi:hypothetical protein
MIVNIFNDAAFSGLHSNAPEKKLQISRPARSVLIKFLFPGLRVL